MIRGILWLLAFGVCLLVFAGSAVSMIMSAPPLVAFGFGLCFAFALSSSREK